jgi:hydrogenase expression/formation protein HypE
VLHEWALVSRHSLVVEEGDVPVTPEVRGACEVLGLDPIHVANEGTMVIAVPHGGAAQTLEVLRTLPEYSGAARIGEVGPHRLAPVIVRRVFGQEIPLDEPLGAPLPRIC